MPLMAPHWRSENIVELVWSYRASYGAMQTLVTGSRSQQTYIMLFGSSTSYLDAQSAVCDKQRFNQLQGKLLCCTLHMPCLSAEESLHFDV